MFHTESACMFMMCVHSKFYKLSTAGSCGLIIAIKRKGKSQISSGCHVAVLHSTKHYLFFEDVLLHRKQISGTSVAPRSKESTTDEIFSVRQIGSPKKKDGSKVGQYIIYL
jgi:hypothetical protein